MEDTYNLDSLLKKIVSNKSYSLVHATEVSSFSYSESSPIKNKGRYFIVSTLKDVVVKKIKIEMEGYMCFVSEKRIYSNSLTGMYEKQMMLNANAFCLKTKDQKNVYNFGYKYFDDFYILYIPKNNKEFAKLKLFGY